MINRITHKQFLTLCDHVIEKQVPLKGKPIAIAIADEAGDIVYIVHMDGVPSRSSIIASGKARTAAKMGRDTTGISGMAASEDQEMANYCAKFLQEIL